ncbi:AER005Cp [Eremothecium gossypii ATCC 10895]|uniref:GPI mannosyltransferase 2 n=1 Tax=Eremothecium gossypii (strain ATCC 10895 / CBS 109.51 / FGSC 9923 / NRRL Y-1056) TaxID=284811 RepID=GPI18_EREGS|nr:AER005Cp [Eremothecium gossypii ATCC 10895]Q757K7.1 RecName: Full=GPI mannosyltransferase 2; AltName: Full=GPI mannosyltransferase II; Short=GPI-MT-II; AltName: Full=Glycosylphosphatidylinositol-anchor biosynthesis protein 18 [Eremothecium gossypii ATCC 10895]AAS52689.1 AER005Cp [Eremothecium gossypii ATCC 10895]AEY96994.1 FAER005Cp [Eremothecium gossypii FDAG1]
MECFKRLTTVFFTVKLVQYLLVYFAPGQFDTSTPLFLEKYQPLQPEKWYHKLLSWDSVYFVKNGLQAVTHTNAYGYVSLPEYEHEWMFSPFVWSQTLKTAGGATLRNWAAPIDTLLVRATLLNLVLHYVSVWLLYALTLRTFPKNRELAYKTSLLFILSSAAGFLLAPYSEPLSFAFSFLGMLLRMLAVEHNVYGGITLAWYNWLPYTLSGICFSVAAANRPNCVLLGVYYIYDVLKLVRQRNWVRAVLFPCIAGSMMLGIFAYMHYYLPSVVFCPERESWCKHSLPWIHIPYKSFYSFVQGYYWRNGFLNYWTWNNVPNFLFALPNLVILWYSTVYFSYQYPLESIRPLVYITRALLLIITFFAHVQIINRISSFIPLHLWYLSDRMIKTTGEAKGDDRLVYLYVNWLILWIPLQTVLFACFLPPA